MITLHRLGHPEQVFINHDMIVGIEANPDTVIKLMTGDRILVGESPEEVAEKVRRCRVEVLAMALRLRGEEAADELTLEFLSPNRVDSVHESNGQAP